MPTVKVRNLKNEEVGEVELSDAVFGAPSERSVDSRRRAEFHGERAAGNVGDEDARRCFRLRPKALEAERHGPRAYRVASFAALEGRRQRSRTAAARLVLQHAEENAPGRACARRCPRGREGNVIIVDGWRFEKPKTKDFFSVAGQART